VLPRLNGHAAAAPNPNCTIIVPANPLSAQGLATPYQLFAPDAAANGPCNEANANQGAFVQATIYDPATGAFSVYSPLVIDKGTQAAVTPTAPTLPANAVVGLWFGFNGTNLTLQGAQGANTLAQGQCVNGLPGSIFGQFSYCNAPNFFSSVNQGIANGLVKVPALGTAKDGMACPTTRDFSVVDQDQSDNVQTQYLANGNGQTAQLTAANQAQLAKATVLGNPSDNALITKFIDPALGCTPWTAPDLANNNTPTLSLALDEIQAAQFQQAPIALVPINDPMTLNNNNPDANKTALYRKGVDQNPGGIQQADGKTYCQNLVTVGLPRIKNDMTITINQTSPDPAAANSLFTFLANRFMQSFMNLNCQQLTGMKNPVTVQMNNNVVTSATITLTPAAAGGVNQVATGNATVTLNQQAGAAANGMNNNGNAANNGMNNNGNAANNGMNANGNAANNGMNNNGMNANGNAANGNAANNGMNNNGNAANNGMNANGNAANNGMNNNGNAANNGMNANGNAANNGMNNNGMNANGNAANNGMNNNGMNANGNAANNGMNNNGMNANGAAATATAQMTATVTYANHPNQQINLNIVTNSCTGQAIFTQAANTDGQGMATANAPVNGLQAMQTIPANWFFTVTDPAQNNQVVGCGSITPNGATGTATLGTVEGAATTTCMNAANGNAANGNAANGNAANGNAANGKHKKHKGNAANGNAANGNAANGNAANGNAANGNAAAATPCATGAAQPAAAGQMQTTTSPAAPASAGQITKKNAPYMGNRKQNGQW
jgi:hypothetical protein